MTHFLIYNSDGDTHVQEINPEAFLKDLEDEEWEFFTSSPKTSNTNLWEGKALIIEGRVVCPKPKAVVTKYKF